MEHLLTREFARKGVTCMLWLVTDSHHVIALIRGYLQSPALRYRGERGGLEPECFSTTRWGEASRSERNPAKPEGRSGVNLSVSSLARVAPSKMRSEVGSTAQYCEFVTDSPCLPCRSSEERRRELVEG